MSASVDNDASLVRELGLFGLKTLVTINGGAIVVLLAFAGNLFGGSEGNKLLVDFVYLRWSAVTFSIGIVSAIFSIFSTYMLVQLRIAGKLPHLSFAWHLGWMIFPATFSLLAFFAGTSLAFLSFG